MAKNISYQALNRLLTVLFRSLPMYLLNTSPWTTPGEAEALAAVRRVAESQQDLGNRVAQFILDHFGPPEVGRYPIDYYDTHDLSLDFLIRKLIRCQQGDVTAIEHVVADLSGDRPSAILAEEALGAARGQLETLEELVGQSTKTA